MINKHKTMRKLSPKKTRKNLFLILALVGVLLLGGGGILLWNTHNTSNSQETSTSEDVNSINFDPPTEEEQQAGDDQKDKIVEEQNNPPVVSNTATVVISDASQYGSTVEVRAFVSNRIDTNGICTVTFTKGSSKITRTKNATADATTTQCGSIEVPRSEFSSAGAWTVNVDYTAGGVSGQEKSTVSIT